MPDAPLLVRPAAATDVTTLLELFGELAEYEHLEHELKATEAQLREALFGERPAAAALWELNGLAETERDERDKYHWIKPAQTRPNRINREWSRIDANDSGDRPVKPDQTESNQIKPNQTCEGEVPMAHGVARERNGVRRGFRVKSSQTQSNRYGEQVGAARRRRSRRTNDSRDHSWPEEFRG